MARSQRNKLGHDALDSGILWRQPHRLERTVGAVDDDAGGRGLTVNEAKYLPAKGEAELFKSRHPIGAAEGHGEIPEFVAGALSFRLQGVQDALERTMLDLGVECD